MLEHFGYSPDPQNPGWFVRPRTDEGLFLDIYGEIRARAENETMAHMKLVPRADHCNIIETVHGGFLLSVVDHALFVGPTVQGRERVARGSTIEVGTQFLAPVIPGHPIDVFVETLRETYRMVFLRGTIEQRGAIAVAFSGTVRKASAKS